MSERPILLLPKATAIKGAVKNGGGSGPAKLGAARQQERLGPRLLELEKAFESKRVQLRTVVAGVVPEDVLVLETAGTTIEEFVNAVGRIDGFEFLSEHDELDIPPDEDFFKGKGGQHTAYNGRVYMVFTNQDAFRQLQGLWNRFQTGEKFKLGHTKWRDVFALLRDIRPWGVKDRLEETGVLTDWEGRVEDGDENVHCEVELWFRESNQKRQAASQAVRSHVQQLGGTVLDEAIVEGIRYHGVAASLPIAAAQRILNEETRELVQLVQSDAIQFFRAAGQMATRASGERAPSARTYSGPPPSGPARVALLDGLPLQNHRALAKRLTVDDPDAFETGYQVHARMHGTAMASLIIWGDLTDTAALPIAQRLYVRPIMRPVFPPSWTGRAPEEVVPEGTLIVDLVHRAVLRMFRGDGNEGPQAPDVALINFSVGIRDRPFSGTLSPLARLLDWLSWEHGVLFIVSAGNCTQGIETGTAWSTLQALAPVEQTAIVMQAVAADTRNRRAFSPAEAMNALTVGASHDDKDSTSIASHFFDPIPRGHPSPLNAHGLGYRRSVKPDLLVPGGRLQFRRPFQSGHTQLQTVHALPPGMEVAAPGVGGDPTHTTRTHGTSNAAALLSRSGALLASVLSELREGNNSALDGIPDGVVLKTLLAHGARWGELSNAFGVYFQSIKDPDKRKDQITRLLGFGRLEVTDVADCSPTRVTAIGAGKLGKEEGAEHRFPLPPSLGGKRGLRRLTLTLSWFTPVNPLSHKWRQAQLWFKVPESKLDIDRVGPFWMTAHRGTLQHDVFEGERAVAFIDGDDVVVRVNCREDAPGLGEKKVPYALAITLEVAEEIGIDIYAEVRERVQQRLRTEAVAVKSSP